MPFDVSSEASQRFLARARSQGFNISQSGNIATIQRARYGSGSSHHAVNRAGEDVKQELNIQTKTITSPSLPQREEVPSSWYPGKDLQEINAKYNKPFVATSKKPESRTFHLIEQKPLLPFGRKREPAEEVKIEKLSIFDPFGLGRYYEAKKERELREKDMKERAEQVKAYNKLVSETTVMAPTTEGMTPITFDYFTQKNLEKEYQKLEGGKPVETKYLQSLKKEEKSKETSVIGLWQGTHPFARAVYTGTTVQTGFGSFKTTGTKELPSYETFKESLRTSFGLVKGSSKGINLKETFKPIRKPIQESIHIGSFYPSKYINENLKEIHHVRYNKQGEKVIDITLFSEKEWKPYAEAIKKAPDEFFKGEYEGIKYQPVRAGISFGIGLASVGVASGFSAGLKATGITAKIASSAVASTVAKGVAITASGGLMGYYGYNVYSRIQSPEYMPGKSGAYKAGFITNTEIAPLISGTYIGSEMFPRIASLWRLRNVKKEIAYTDITNPQVTSGRERFAQFKPGTTPEEAVFQFKQGKYSFQRAIGKGRTEIPIGFQDVKGYPSLWKQGYWISGYSHGYGYPSYISPQMWHTTTSNYGNIMVVATREEITKMGLTPSELEGLFGAPTLPQAFLRLDKGINLYPSKSLGYDFGTPTAYVIYPKDISVTPGNIKGLDSANKWLLSGATPEKAYVTLGIYPKLEEQAILPPKAVLYEPNPQPSAFFWKSGYKIGVREFHVIGSTETINIPEVSGITPVSLASSSSLISIPSYSSVNPYSMSSLSYLSSISAPSSIKSPSYVSASYVSYPSIPSSVSVPSYGSYSYPSTPYSSYKPPSSPSIIIYENIIPPVIIPVSFDLSGGGEKRKPSLVLRNQPKRYQPSFGALALNIKSSKIPKAYTTGITIRPIISSRKILSRSPRTQKIVSDITISTKAFKNKRARRKALKFFKSNIKIPKIRI